MNDFKYSCLKSILYIFSRFPLKAGYVFSRFLYVLLVYIIRYRKKVIYSNLKMVFPEKDEQEISSIIRKFYRHLSEIIVEIAYSLHIPAKEIDRRVKFVNPEILNKYYSEGRHLVGLACHYANWEWGYRFQSMTPFNLIEIYKKLNNSIFDRLFREIRGRFGGTPVEMSSMKTVFIESKKSPVFLYLVADQSPLDAENTWYYTSFLGIDGTPIFTGPEKIARKLDAALVYIDVQKIKRGFYQIEFTVLCDSLREKPENYALDLYLQKTEEIIRKQPELWFWTHRRWKRRRTAK